MMMTDIFARRNSTNKNKLLQKKSVAAYSIQNSPNFNLSISAPDICLYESILTQSMSPYPLNNTLIHFVHGIAQAIMENPKILILDEPFNGLDKDGVKEMREYLLSYKEQGKTILICSHSAEDISVLCDTVHEMDKGVIEGVR